ncbi:ion transporter [Flavobacteriales bacterium]|nr:ion transporter [Flavobacteriales bacterium]
MYKENIREIIFGINTKAGRRFDLVLLIVIIISVIGVILSSDVEIEEKYGNLLYIAEWIFTILFTIEYILRIYSAPNRKKYIFSFMGIVDLLAIIPTYLMFLFPPIKYLVDIRIIRLIRIFRILKLTNYIRGAYTMQIALRSSRPKIVVFLLYIFIVVIIVGTLMYILEGPKNGFNNIAESIYWAIITLTTVGYGNIVPATALGKMLAAFIMILGYAVIAVPTGIVSSEFTKNKKEKIAKEKRDKILERENKILEMIENLDKKIDKLN